MLQAKRPPAIFCWRPGWLHHLRVSCIRKLITTSPRPLRRTPKPSRAVAGAQNFISEVFEQYAIDLLGDIFPAGRNRRKVG